MTDLPLDPKALEKALSKQGTTADWLRVAAVWISDPDMKDRAREIIEEAADAFDGLAAAPQPPAGDGWMPIETAPKDGTRVLIFDGEMIAVAWAENGYAWVLRGAWISEYARSDTYTYQPTHWMPLPEPPK